MDQCPELVVQKHVVFKSSSDWTGDSFYNSFSICVQVPFRVVNRYEIQKALLTSKST